MKKLSLIAIGLTWAMTSTVYAQNPEDINYITREEARAIAYSHAGVEPTEVDYNYVNLDWDDFDLEYEVEFWVGDMEYDYEINAATGMIVDYDYDVEHDWYKWIYPFISSEESVTIPTSHIPDSVESALAIPAMSMSASAARCEN
ncbi:MAG: hypothetical protein BEN18_04655 [Epulopiscium sp. Nuni2H_MBin001]|nr:MAG: hypothetical protein BEN18_04655 [Epulopiscium sp. Nuni2H_MBin001]